MGFVKTFLLFVVFAALLRIIRFYVGKKLLKKKLLDESR
jgi:hypothetical protein